MMVSRQSSRCGDICGICRDTLTDPRELPCTHSFCLLCLRRHIYFARQDCGKSFTCPLCRREYPINRGRTSKDIAKSFRRKIQRTTLTYSSGHRMAFTADVLTNDNNPVFENDNISRNDRRSNSIINSINNQNRIPAQYNPFEPRGILAQYNPFEPRGIPAQYNPFEPREIPAQYNPFEPRGIPAQYSPFEPRRIPAQYNPFKPRGIPAQYNPFEPREIPAQYNPFEPRGIPAPYNPFEPRGISAQYNPFEPRGINIENFNIRKYIVQDSTQKHSTRKQSPKTDNYLNPIRLPPISQLQQQSNDASIKKSEMSHDMEQDAINCVINAKDRLNDHKDIAGYVKREFDRKYNQPWHCIVGTAFGSFVSHETNCVVYFKVSGVFNPFSKSG